MILRELSRVEANRKDLGKFIDTKWANGNGKALEQFVGEFSFFLLDPK
jgi:hypothetical protein